MKIDWKKTIKIAAILGSFAAIGGISVAVVNVFTAPRIEAYKVEKEQKGLQKIFGGLADCDPSEKVELSEADSPYLLAYYPAYEAGSKTLMGRIYSTSGTNAYGSVSLLVGLTSSFSLYNLVVMENTESYAQTLVDNYLNPLIQSADKESALDEVKCGATYGAKLVRSMVEQAKEHYRSETEGQS